jgi:hypothetical protein
MEDTDSPGPAPQHHRFGQGLRKMWLKGRQAQQQAPVRVQVEAFRLTIEGTPTDEHVRLMRQFSEALGMAQPTGASEVAPKPILIEAGDPSEPVDADEGDRPNSADRPQEYRAEMRGLEQASPVGHSTKNSRITTRLKQAGVMLPRVVKDVLTELFARLVGHALHFPP